MKRRSNNFEGGGGGASKMYMPTSKVTGGEVCRKGILCAPSCTSSGSKNFGFAKMPLETIKYEQNIVYV